MKRRGVHAALEVHKRLDHDYDDDGFLGRLQSNRCSFLGIKQEKGTSFRPVRRGRDTLFSTSLRSHPLLFSQSHPLVFSSSSSSLSSRISFLFLEEEVISMDSPTDTLPFSSSFFLRAPFLVSFMFVKIIYYTWSSCWALDMKYDWKVYVCLVSKPKYDSQIMTCLRLDIILNLTLYLFASSFVFSSFLLPSFFLSSGCKWHFWWWEKHVLPFVNSFSLESMFISPVVSIIFLSRLSHSLFLLPSFKRKREPDF